MLVLDTEDTAPGKSRIERTFIQVSQGYRDNCSLTVQDTEDTAPG